MRRPSRTSRLQTVFEKTGRRGCKQGKKECTPTHGQTTRGHLRQRRHDCAHTSVKWTQRTQCAVCALWCVCVVHVSRARCATHCVAALRVAHCAWHTPPWDKSQGGHVRACAVCVGNASVCTVVLRAPSVCAVHVASFSRVGLKARLSPLAEAGRMPHAPQP